MILIWIFMMINEVEYLFMSCWPFVWLFWKKCLFRSFAQFLARFFSIKLYEILYIYCVLTPNTYIICTYFLPFHRFHFYFVGGFPYRTENIWCSSTRLILLLLPCFYYQIKKNIAKKFNLFWFHFCVWWNIMVQFYSFTYA